jgi:hypothetical protein
VASLYKNKQFIPGLSQTEALGNRPLGLWQKNTIITNHCVNAVHQHQ